MPTVNVVGAGLAGVEAVWQLNRLGVKVRLFEMKPLKFSPAHHSEDFSELVCSNSLKAMNIDTGAGLLKEEMRMLGSLCYEAAMSSKVAAGGALAVDRDKFSSFITSRIKGLSGVEIIRGEIKSLAELPESDGDIIATGPLTSDLLAEDLQKLMGKNEMLSFYDAAAPVVYADSIDNSKVFMAARYGKGTADYLNCPMNKEQYLAFYNALINSEKADVKGFDKKYVYEGCMPVEVMAERGEDTLRFGPLKPVGLDNPETGESYYAVVQLRKENEQGSLYNLVGFQTRLKFPEQKRVFGMIPGLENAEFARFGVMHRNTYIKSPGVLSPVFKFLPSSKPLYFAGQITGTEGYMESADCGIMAGINMGLEVLKKEPFILPVSTMTGALGAYVSSFAGKDFQPMGANFGIMESDSPLLCTGKKIKDKALKKKIISDRAIEVLGEYILKLKNDVSL